MQAVKTAISVDKNLYDQANQMAKEMKLSRSKLFVLALQEFIEHQKNKEMLAQINAAYEEDMDPAEETLQSKRSSQHRRLVEGEW